MEPTKLADASTHALLEELTAIRERLREAEETIAAIRDGEVDAVVVRGKVGEQVYTLENADRPFRALIERMQEGAVTVSDDRSILYCNQYFAALAGAGSEKIIGTPIGVLFPDWPSTDVKVQTPGEVTLRRLDGGTKRVNLSLAKMQLEPGAAPILCAVVSDLTAAHRRSGELRESNERLAQQIQDRTRAETSLRLALSAAGMGEWEYEYASKTIHHSMQHDQIYGYATAPSPWTFADVLERYVPEDRERLVEQLRQLHKTGESEFEGRIQRADDGRIRWVRISAQLIYAAGAPARMVGVIGDVTNRRIVEERIRQAQKMDAIGQLTGGVAHDFNNLLQVIAGGLQLIDRVQDKTRRENIMKGMRQAVDRGSGLSRQLLAFSRKQSLKPEPIDLVRQILGMRELLDRSLRGDVHVVTDFEAGLWPVEVDPGEFELVILNLALNARDAMPSGGNIVVRARNSDASCDEQFRCEHVRLEIVDQGTGMTADVMARAFEPFFTTKEIGKGSGLGLAQAHGFARASGGELRLDSTPGRGTAVILLLPRSQKTPLLAEDQWADTVVLPALPQARGQVLLVEDDDEVAALTSEMIRELGFVTTRVSGAAAALGALADGRRVDIVFSDVMMPGDMNGLQLALEIRRRKPGLAVILTSGYAEDIKRAAAASDILVVPKPFRLDDLDAAFRTARRQA
jgi:PAS domain S-box-containing protein